MSPSSLADPIAVARALGQPVAAVVAVELLESFEASTAEVGRVRISFADGRAPLVVIGKRATGRGLADAQRELEFFAHLAPLWDHPAPALLGFCREGEGEQACLLLLTEDLGAAGYALASEGVSPAQLGAVTDTLVRLHARFWEQLPAVIRRRTHSQQSLTQSAQAWPASVIPEHARAVRQQAEGFFAVAGAGADASAGAGDELAAPERALLGEVLLKWEPQFLARVAEARAITLLHGDFHLLGNVFFSPASPQPRVIDWSELKPGLGPHDLAYCLFAAPVEERVARDLSLLRRYWEGLGAAGVRGYGWELCQWDFRFSLLTNLLQSVLQHSTFWFTRTAAVATLHDAVTALRDPPPMSA